MAISQPRPRWFDTHVHLERYGESERQALLARAADAGVTRMLCVSVALASSRNTVALPENVLKAVGVHPTRAAEAWPGELSELEELARSPGVVAIGETGFDGTGPPFAVQEAVFWQQCTLARELKLALVLHIDGPGAWEALLQAGEALAGLTVVRHYFRGDEAQLRWHAARGHFVSFGRPLLRDAALQALARLCPLELLLIETDSYPSPGRATEPRDVIAVGERLADLRGWSNVRCAEQLWQNSARAFGLPLAH